LVQDSRKTNAPESQVNGTPVGASREEKYTVVGALRKAHTENNNDEQIHNNAWVEVPKRTRKVHFTKDALEKPNERVLEKIAKRVLKNIIEKIKRNKDHSLF
jgi:hypothetical protein